MLEFDLIMGESQLRVTLSGNFQKHLELVICLISEFSDLGVEVLSPEFTVPKKPSGELILLQSGAAKDSRDLEKRHLAAIKRSDFLYLVNPEGELGKTASFEMGYAISKGVPIVALENVNDLTLKFFCQGTGRPKQILQKYRSLFKRELDRLAPNPSLSDLQNYLQQVAVKRGLTDGPSQDVLFLIEEMAELTNSMRKSLYLNINPPKGHRYSPIEGDLADALISLLSLANRLKINLEQVFRLKENENEHLFWKKSAVPN